MGEVVRAGEPVVILERTAGRLYTFVPESEPGCVSGIIADVPGVGRVRLVRKPVVEFIPGTYVFDDFRAIKGVEYFSVISALNLKEADILDLKVRREDAR